LVWMQAARFLGRRVQGSAGECNGREPDMSAGSAEALRAAAARIEAASKLISNREVVARDITNPGPRGVKGGVLSQGGLKRLDSKHYSTVDTMLQEVSRRLLGKGADTTTGDQVWADAAKFFSARVQDPQSMCDVPHENRKADMSMAAAKALRTTLGQMEAAHRLLLNRQMVLQDITNAGQQALKGGPLTQLALQRVDSRQTAAVDAMLQALISRLNGREVSGPSAAEEALVWVQAATYLSGRIQSSAGEMPGREPDMGRAAARAMKAALAEFEASSKLMSNRETVVLDITNSGPSAVKGGRLTQGNLKRVDGQHRGAVDKMTLELCGGLLGRQMKGPAPGEAQAWEQAAAFLNSRIQKSKSDCPGRNADMSADAAAAMRAVLAVIASDPNVGASSSEAENLLAGIRA